MDERRKLYPALEKAFKDRPELFKVLLETNTPRGMGSMEVVATNYAWFGPELVRSMVVAEKAAKKVGGE